MRKGNDGWKIVLWILVILSALFISKALIEAIINSDMPLWLKIMILK